MVRKQTFISHCFVRQEFLQFPREPKEEVMVAVDHPGARDDSQELLAFLLRKAIERRRRFQCRRRRMACNVVRPHASLSQQRASHGSRGRLMDYGASLAAICNLLQGEGERRRLRHTGRVKTGCKLVRLNRCPCRGRSLRQHFAQRLDEPTTG